MRKKHNVSFAVMGLMIGFACGYVIGREDVLSEIKDWRKKRLKKTRTGANPTREIKKPVASI